MPTSGGAGRPRGTARSRLRVELVAPPAASTRGLVEWLTRVAPRGASGQITIALVSDRRIAALNSRFRRQRGATDVLSFPADEPPHLGDVLIAQGVARRQAARAGHSLTTELRVLALHGLLHLLGYDHEHDDG